MAEKEEIGGEKYKEIKTKLQEKKVVIGTERVLKELKAGHLQKIFIAKNCPQRTKEDLNRYAPLSGVKLIELYLSNEELGLFCKKNFFVAALGILRD